ncbi:inositol 3-kinase-like isoform X2 [Populus nigra]|uniref:inositol 3-kinase-like isoform X2 n=1 Tax=Populus nigra TaxID=3691 RepID=UPI002B27335D|nr:inositol 3-kinase-like isoform X2 [Populus nigra]
MVTTAESAAHKSQQQSRVLIVGNYCHDVLIQNNAVKAVSLGGAASFISNVFNGVSVSCNLVSKVGEDFKYPVSYTPIVIPTLKTTVFHSYFDPGLHGNDHQDRILKRVCACDPIRPSDLPETRFKYGMAVGVGGEILPETLERMIEICDVVFADIQALIRVFDGVDGTVKLVKLEETGFYTLLPRIGVLKASSEEAVFMDVEKVRKWCCVVVTNGKHGCKVYWKDGELGISPFLANQEDPTGAGDSFFGGFVAGLVQGLAVPDAALLGNLFGSLSVEQVGLPTFDTRLLQAWLVSRNLLLLDFFR